jgi:hypothetical protein
VLVTGGALPNNTGSLKDAYFYDPKTDTWAPAPALNQARCAHSSVAVSDRAIVFGGLSDCSNGSALGPGLEELTPASPAWKVVNAPGGPGLRYNGVAVALPTREMLVLGGNGQSMVPVGRYDPLRQSWRDASCSLPNCSTDWMAAFVIDDNTVVAWGGYGNAAGQKLDLRANTWAPWTRPPGTPGATGQPTLYTESVDRWFLLEGQDCSRDVTVNIFDKATGRWSVDKPSPVEGLAGFGAGTVNAAWTGAEVFVWSAQCRGEPHGGRYQPPAP